MRKAFLIFILSLNFLFAQNLDYPILFIHGYNSNPQKTWFVAGLPDYLENTLGLGTYQVLDACLNNDGNQTTSSLSQDTITFFNPSSMQNLNYYFLNFDIDPDQTNQYNNTVNSDQSAIVKQGAVISYAIKCILSATGADNVYLVGHSMGGLASREYVQNPQHWQPDGQHHIEKVITIGTPNWGANTTDVIPAIVTWYTAWNNSIDPKSEATRDMRYHYNINVGSSFPPTTAIDTAIYLFGGQEADIPSSDYHNTDVNCDGNDDSPIILPGLNDSIPNGIDFIWYQGKHSDLTGLFGHPSDGVVRYDRQRCLNVGLSREILGDVYHSEFFAGLAPFNPKDYETQKFTQYLQPIFSIVETNITQDTTFTLANSPFIVTDEVIVNNAILTIEPGVEVYFTSGAGLRIAHGSPGSLQANGTTFQPILFTSNSGLDNDWKGIVFDDRSDNSGWSSSLTNCTIEKAGQANVYGIPAEIYCRVTNGVSISQCTIGLPMTNPSRGVYSIYCTQSSPTISNSTINNTGGNAIIYLNNNSGPGINNNNFVASGNPYWIFADQNNCSPNIAGNVFSGNVTKALRLGTQFQMIGNSFSGASNRGIEVIGGEMVGVSRTWHKETGDSIYIVINDDLLLHRNSTLTVDPGVTVKFSSGTALWIGKPFHPTYGSLYAIGTQNEPIIFTSTSGSSGGWEGILFDDDSDSWGATSTMTYCIVENAGQSNAYGVNANVFFRYTTTPSIDHCTIRNCIGSEIYFTESSSNITNSIISNNTSYEIIHCDNNSSPSIIGATITGNGNSYWLQCIDSNCNPNLSNNTFNGNVNKSVRLGTQFQMSGNSFSGASNRGIEVIGGEMVGVSRTWHKETGDSIYIVINDDLLLHRNSTLTVDPGVTVKFSSGTALWIGKPFHPTYGSLYAIGTQNEPIIFTSTSGSSGGWKGIIFDTDSDSWGATSTMTHCIVENAGLMNYYNTNAAIYFYNTNAVYLDNCSIQNNGGIGLKMNISSPDLSNSQIINNGMEGIYIEGNSNPSIGNSLTTSNDIYNNGIYELYNNSTNDINALYNYWGTIDGTIIESKIYHRTDNPSLGEVFYNPWVDENHNLIIDPNAPPPMPIIILPISGSEMKPADWLVWSKSNDPYEIISYQIQIADENTFTNPIIDYTSQFDSIFTKEGKIEFKKNKQQKSNSIAVKLNTLPGWNNLQDDYNYFWRVQALDNHGGESGFTDSTNYFFFNKINTPPNPVTAGFSPAAGDTIINLTPEISWFAATDPDLSDHAGNLYYILQLNDTSDFYIGYKYQYVTLPGQNSVFILDTLTDDQYWYYRIQTVDDDSATSSWSDMQNFYTYFPQPPGVFDLLSPVNHDTIDSLTIVFDWEDAIDPDAGDHIFYRLYYSNGSEFDSIMAVGIDSIGESEYHLLNSLSDDSTYSWRVYAYDKFGHLTRSRQNYWNFTFKINDAPQLFSLYYPSDGDTLDSMIVQFEWQPAVDPDGDMIYYGLSIFNDSQDTLILGLDSTQLIFTGDDFFAFDTIYNWTVNASDGQSITSSPDTFHFIIRELTGIDEYLISGIPKAYVLFQNYPNPFNPITTIKYGLPLASNVKLEVFDLLGRRVSLLVNKKQDAGYFQVQWDSGGLASGIYIYRMVTDKFVKSRKMTLLR